MDAKGNATVIALDSWSGQSGLEIEDCILQFLDIEFEARSKWNFVYLSKYGMHTEASGIKWLNIIQWITGICRSLKILPSQRSLILSTKLQQQAIQLSLAKINKQKIGEFSAAASDVLDLWKYLKTNSGGSMHEESLEANDIKEAVTSYEEFLARCCFIDQFDLKKIIRQHKDNPKFSSRFQNTIFVLEDFTELCQIEKDFLLLVLAEAKVFRATPSLVVKDNFNISGIGSNSSILEEKESKDPMIATESATLKIVREPLSLEEFLEEALIDAGGNESDPKGSISYVEDLFIAHLRLLVNTRDELALALSLGMPGREISLKEFNKIKLVAFNKKMPIYQTIMSTVLRLQLGGRGYRPVEECPIVQNSKSLSEVVNLINQMQETVEEETDGKKGYVKILNRLKNNFLRTKGCSLPSKSIDLVHRKFLSEVDSIEGYFEECNDFNVEQKPEVASQTFAINTSLQPTLKLLIGACDRMSGKRVNFSLADVIRDDVLTQKTPISEGKKCTPFKVPSMVSMFRSPLSPTSSSPKGGEKESPKEENLRVRMMKQKGILKKTPSRKCQKLNSHFSWLPDNLSPIYKSSPVSPSDVSPIAGPTLNVLAPKNESRIDWNKVLTNPLTPQIPKTSPLPKKRSKRSLLTDISNLPDEPQKKKTKEVTSSSSEDLTKKKKKEVPKKIEKEKKNKKTSLLKGQTTITSFFNK